MTIFRFAAAAGLAALALSACGQKDDAQPGAVPPKTAAPAAAPLADNEWPQPTPGFWEQKVQVNAEDQGTVSRICYDAALAKRLGVIGQQDQAKMNCKPAFSRGADGSLVVDSTCTGSDGQVTTSRSVIRGDFSKAYTVEVTNSDDPAGDTPGKLTVTRLGDCPVDFKPGDMEMAGIRMNLNSVISTADAPPTAPAP